MYLYVEAVGSSELILAGFCAWQDNWLIHHVTYDCCNNKLLIFWWIYLYEF